MKIAVIIPFYQREAGILARTLDSVLHQDLTNDFRLEVIVVDDSSPVPAEQEMSAYQKSDRITWRWILQANTGPGGARNTGLDLVTREGGFDYIAFLDSDDEWAPDHLSRALMALGQGYDFYFSDHRREGYFDSHFDEIDLPMVVTDLVWHRGIEIGANLRGFRPHDLDHAVLREYLSQSSTVVLREETQGHHRFDTELRHASEDRMMWIQIALSGAKICISTRSEVECGRGINMCFANLGWDSSDAVARLGSQILFGQKLALMANGPSRQWVNDNFSLGEKLDLYSYLTIRNLLKGRPEKLGSLRTLMKRDQLLPLRMLPRFVSFALFGRRRMWNAQD